MNVRRHRHLNGYCFRHHYCRNRNCDYYCCFLTVQNRYSDFWLWQDYCYYIVKNYFLLSEQTVFLKNV